MKTKERTIPRKTAVIADQKPRVDHVELRFCALTVGQTRDEVVYLGYPLRLSKTEYAMLARICQAGTWLSREALADCCPGKNPVAVPIHIAALNRKADAIGGRPLIETGRGKGYRLAPDA